MNNLFGHLKKYKTNLIIGPLFKLLEAIFELFVPLVMADIIDNGLNNPSSTVGYIVGRGGLLIALGVVGLACSLVCQITASRCSQGFGTDLRNSLFAHIGGLSYSQIDELGQASLLTRLTSDINQLQVAVAMGIRLVTRAPFLVIGSVVMSIIINPKLGLVFVVATPLLAIAVYFIMTASIKLYSKIQIKQDKVNALARENLSGTRVIRAFSRSDQQIINFNKASEEVNTDMIMVGKISALLNPINILIINLSIIAILYFGSNLVYNGEITQGQIVAFINYLLQISLALVIVANLVVIYTKSHASAKRVAQVLDTQAQQDTADIDTITPTDEPIISFENIAFGYNLSNNVLDDINFSIYEGQRIGIIGGTGSGKSTLTKLIPRLYETTQGSVKIYGVDNKNIKPLTLRSFVRIAEQNTTLFSGTIRSNLLIAKEDATDEELWQALEIAQAKDFVMSKDNMLDSSVKERGNNFSGGQKQRISIARALLSNPKCLILDDSVSALDLLTEKRFFQALNKHTNNMTIIVVSQRTGSLKNCDKIIVLDKGKIVGFDTHSNLIKDCLTYQEIYYSQNKEEKK